MLAPLSMDVRRRSARLVEGGVSERAAARLIISASASIRLAVKVREDEAIGPAKCGRRRSGACAPIPPRLGRRRSARH